MFARSPFKMINLVALNTKLNDKIRNSIALFITASHGFLVGKTFSIFLFANQATKAIFVGFLVGKTILCEEKSKGRYSVTFFLH